MLSPSITQTIITFLAPHGALKIALFGSYARGDEKPDSDIDLLVTFGRRQSLLKLVTLEQELSELLGKKVDLLTEKAISPYLIDRIKSNSKVIYQ